jgi:hypothetical protein
MTTTELEAWDKGFCAGLDAGVARVRQVEHERDQARGYHMSARQQLTVAMIWAGAATIAGLACLLVMLR